MNTSSDLFNEQLVTKESSPKDLAKKVGIISFAVVLAFAILALIPSILLIVLIIEGLILVFLFRRFNVEYEYILTNYELDIDRIYNKMKRKKGISIDVKRFSIVVPVLKKEYENELSKVDKVLDFSSGVVKENTYAAIYTMDGKRIKLIFEPNEKLLKSIKMYCPSSFKK
ncbi:MAG: hypothetical protein H7X94_09730 [Vallitaleaceae bacterium]|nr:hypothetical protein [Vallitaleaceae bacterium]